MPSNCNKKYQDAAEKLWCGDKTCVNHNRSDGDEDKDKGDLELCPVGYTEARMEYFDRVWPRADQYKRECHKDPDDPHWNQLTHKVLDEDTGELKDNILMGDMNNIFKCCDKTKLQNTDECGDLYIDPDKSDCSGGSCDAIRQLFCKGENLNTSMCKKFCKENPDKCDQSLRTFCDDKMGQSGYKDICSCYYPSEVYEDMVAAFSQQWNIPEELNSANPYCIYHACQNATVVPAQENPCPAVNIASCIQNVELSAEGAVISELNLEQDADCRAELTGNYNISDSGNGVAGGNGANGSGNSASDSDNNADEDNDTDEDADEDNDTDEDSEDSDNNTLFWILLGVGILFLSLLCSSFAVVLMKNNKPQVPQMYRMMGGSGSLSPYLSWLAMGTTFLAKRLE